MFMSNKYHDDHNIDNNIVLPIPRVHNISREGECLTAYIPCTNALR